MNPKQFSIIRIAHGYTQPDLAEKINVSLRTIASWESGERKPPIDKLEMLADFYGVSTDFLLGRTSLPSPHTSNYNTDHKLLISQFDTLNHVGKNMVLDYINVIAGNPAMTKETMSNTSEIS